MRRVLLAGVSLTVTACALSTSPPPSAVSSRSAAPSPYVLALADGSGQCTLWREVAGQRECLDGAPPQLAAATAPPPAAAPRMAVTAQQLDAPRTNLFDEMKRMGMIRQDAPAPASAVAAEAPPLPGLPKPDPAMIAAVAPAQGSKALAFAATDMPAAPAARSTAAPRVSTVVTQSWAAVEPLPAAAPAPVQLAASTPQAHDTVGRAPVTPVEKAPLPIVRSSTVVPLKISERATEDRPAVVVPAIAMPALPPAAAPQMAQSTAQSAPAASLPALPSLPPLPGATAPDQSAAPVAAPVTSAPVPPPAAAAASTRTAPAAQLQPPVPPPLPAAGDPPAAKPSPLARALGAPTAAPKAEPMAAAAKLMAQERASKAAAKPVPKSTAAAPTAGRYLVLQSFRERERADRLAEDYRKLDAKVASVTIKGQTWHRVVVRDGATERKRLASEGMRGFWPVTL